MSLPPVITVTNVDKAYEIYARPLDIVKDKLFGGKRHDTFWALRDVSFEVREKQRVGILGPNGAGKSTLLQIISGNLQPTRGSIAVDGRVSALLSLVPAWNPEETGVQNIEFNLLLRGCPQDRIPELAEEIIEFTELGPFIYQPVKTYSAGMGARLSFAIATALSPEILIIDEVLSAGDGYFAVKAAERMKKMCERGKALLFVSHSIAAVRQMCDTAIWLENGSIRMMGPMDEVASKYEEDIARKHDETEREHNRKRALQTMNLVAPDEIDDHDACRFRIRTESRPGVYDTHYIRSIRIGGEAGDALEIPLDSHDLNLKEGQASLDPVGCEWGRDYTKQGVACRMLSPRTGARKGGHFFVRRPEAARSRPWNLELRIASSSLNNREALCVEFLNLAAVKWEMMAVRERRRIDATWEEVVCAATIPSADKEQKVRAVEKARLDLLPAAQIRNACLIVDGEPALSVKEKQPFALRVTVQYHKPTPPTSVNVGIIRTDGVPVFFQPSGLFGQNIENFEGEAKIDFVFDPNPFGASEYEIKANVCNGWSWDNVPVSEVIDRSIGVYRFSVQSAEPIIFGIVNMRFPVRVQLGANAPEQRDALPSVRPSA